MSSEITKLSDVIVPEIFNAYVSNKTMELSALAKSGIITTSAEYGNLASTNGYFATIPFFQDLTGSSTAIVEGADLEAMKIKSSTVNAPILRRAAMWASTDLAAALSGKDPMKEIASKVAGFWERDLQKELISILNGIFGTYKPSEGTAKTPLDSNIHDTTSATSGGFSASGFLDAEQKLGDAKGQLTAIAMHSLTHADLLKKDLITFEKESSGRDVQTYRGKRIIVDDGCPLIKNSSGKVTGATTFLFGEGAFAYGNGSPVGFIPTEIDRDKKKGSGVDYLINRKTYVLHPAGISFTGISSVTNKEGITRTDLENAAYWEPKFENKQIKIVAYKHKLS